MKLEYDEKNGRLESPEGVKVYTKYFGSVEEIKYVDPNVQHGPSVYYGILV